MKARSRANGLRVKNWFAVWFDEIGSFRSPVERPSPPLRSSFSFALI
jgi:hypothetical protein